MIDRPSLRPSATLLLAGEILFILVTQLHADGPANEHRIACAVATVALYGALQAVDGVALKQAVDAWAAASDSEKAARFANAEAVRWLEWGVRNYQNFALGASFILFAAAIRRAASIPLPITYLVCLAAFCASSGRNGAIPLGAYNSMRARPSRVSGSTNSTALECTAVASIACG